jgi:hypothetical protein
MAEPRLLQLAQDLEWLGHEQQYYGQRSAEAAVTDAFIEKQRAVLSTADKIERELMGAVRFNPTSLMGIEYPLEENFDTLMSLLSKVEDIKQASVDEFRELSPRVRQFSRMLETYLETALPSS